MLFKNWYFWVISALFVAIISFSSIMLIPPSLAKLQENRDKIELLKIDLATQEKYLASVKAIEGDKTTLVALYDKAYMALPDQPKSDVLMLQFDGLLATLGLPTVSLNVPLTAAAPAAASSEAAAGAAASPPTNVVAVTISGNISYETLIELLKNLRVFSRWNRVSDFDLSKSGDKYSASLTTNAYYKSGAVGEFSGDSAILTKAAKIFNGLTTHTAAPDITKEGQYGRNNPFNP